MFLDKIVPSNFINAENKATVRFQLIHFSNVQSFG